ncbi:ABC transporter permease [Nocardioides gilvus]|uniref:ABC transporter permease n=1 Tax=Nocardioides gilvus TaxID=1735589 RepID=UPI000D744740|nr:ABC transporter permease [Nocardioides gilvus]
MSTGTFTPDPGGAPLGRQVMAQAGMEARLILRNGEQLLLAVVIPVVVLLGGIVASKRIDLNLSERPIDLLAPGVLALAIMSTAFTSTAIATGFERRYGVIKRLGASPLPRHGLLLGKVLALLVVEAFQIVVVAALALSLGWDPSVSILGVLLASVLGTAAFGALGLLVAGLLRAEATLAFANLVYLLLMVGGAVVIPVDEYGALGQVVRWLPSGALGESMREALIHGSPAWIPLLVLVGWAAVGAALTARTFRWE